MSEASSTDLPVSLSVIIPAYKSMDTLPDCLDSLRCQQDGVDFEIIVVVSGADGSEGQLQQDFPESHILACVERKLPGQARNLGAARATGDILLFLDADSILATDGVKQALVVHRRFPNPLIGGVIEPAQRQAYAAWGQYFAGLTAWMSLPDAEPTEVSDVATGCCSIKRWAFERYGPFSDIRYCEDTLLSWHIAKAGYPPLLAPGLRARHEGLDSARQLLRRKFRHGWAFAQIRAHEHGWKPAKCVAHMVVAPLVPLLLLYRGGRDVWRDGRYRRRFLLAFPVTLAALVSWSTGEAAGLLRMLVGQGSVPHSSEN